MDEQEKGTLVDLLMWNQIYLLTEIPTQTS